LSLLIVSFGIHYGYIGMTGGGKFTGILGGPIQFIINQMADVWFPFVMFFCDIAFTLLFRYWYLYWVDSQIVFRAAHQ